MLSDYSPRGAAAHPQASEVEVPRRELTRPFTGPSPERALPGRTLAGRRLLLGGFGGLLLLMLLAAIYALVVLRQVRSSDTHVRDLYLRRANALDLVRTGIYQSALVMRAYLLARDEHEAAFQLAIWNQAREGTDQALKDCMAVLDTADTAAVRALQAEVQDYWRLLEYVTTVPEKDRRVRGAEYLTSEVVRRRGQTLDLLDRIDQMNAREMAYGDAQLNKTYNQLRWRLALMLGATIAAGMLLAVFTAQRILRLENELTERYGEGVRARQELQELSARLVSAQEQERRAISRELHDEVGQSLSALLMEAGNAAARVPPESVEVRRHVDSIKKLAEASVNVIRNMTLLLRPSMLDDFGLIPALEWQAREVSKRTGLRVHVSARESAGDLPDEHKTCIYRVVQEALHNCARHSHARSVRVVVDQLPAKIVLTVDDDGRGFDSLRVRGLGLVGMEERVHHLGGTFRIRSELGAGTKLTVELPLAGARDAAAPPRIVERATAAHTKS
ncbi:MAG: histidine kinase [Bryobacterales bacterium]|nr:histidine kinase [Bryobacterales bacterium]MBV9398808.1 histidine kinase [Bryobacterales bacterium]